MQPLNIDSTLGDAMDQLRNEIAERQAALATLERFTQVSAKQISVSGTKSVAAKTVKSKTPRKKRRGVRGEIPKADTRAGVAYKILSEATAPMPQTAIRDRFRDDNIEPVDDGRFLTKLSTALNRHPKIFTRLNDKRWVLTSRLKEFQSEAGTLLENVGAAAVR